MNLGPTIESYIGEMAGHAHQSSNWFSATAKEATTTALVPMMRRKAARIARETPELKLHLGAGEHHLDGWTNIDLYVPRRNLELFWDLRRGIPFPDNSAVAIFAEHLFEHIPLGATLIMLRECRRVLKPGGILRIGVPDLERYVHAYMGTDPLFEECLPNRPTRAAALNEVFYFYRHRFIYDFETLDRLCKEAGYTRVEKSAFGAGRIQPSPDLDMRKCETLYVEAEK
jgi:predicted SAM-dependent methyltransferase